VESSLRLRRFYRFCSLQLAVAQCLRPRVSKAQRRYPSARRAAARRRARVPSRTRAGAPPRPPRSRRSPRSATQSPLETSSRIRREPNRMLRVCGAPITAVVKGDQDLSASGEGRTAQPLWPRPRSCRSAEPSRAIHHPSCATRTTPPRMPRRVGWGVDGHLRRDRASVGRRRCISGSPGAARCSAADRLRVPVPG
jgi:hypothetical protein